MRTVAVLGVGVLAAVAGAVAAASHGGSPVRVGGVERTDTWAVLFLALLAVAFVLYIAALFMLRSGRQPLVLVATIAAAIQLMPLAGPLLLSRDVYSYWAYGRIVVTHGRNPFTTAPSRFPYDPATQAAAWRRQTSVYGPAFTLGSAAVADMGGHSAELHASLFRIVAAVAGIAATLLAAALARRGAFAAAFLGWNPLVALSFAGGGHNDALMVALLLAALALVAQRRDVEAGVLWVLAAAIKAPALPLLAFEARRPRRRLMLGAGAAALTVGAASTAAFGTSWLTSIWQLQGREAHPSLPARLEQAGLPEGAAHGIAYAIVAAGLFYLLRRAHRDRPSLALGASLLVLGSAWVLPWYGTWPVALAAVEEGVLPQVVALGLALYLLPDRVPL